MGLSKTAISVISLAIPSVTLEKRPADRDVQNISDPRKDCRSFVDEKFLIDNFYN